MLSVILSADRCSLLSSVPLYINCSYADDGISFNSGFYVHLPGFVCLAGEI
jgi:hypothetical protein